MVIVTTYMVFEKLRFQNVFRPRENAKPAFSNSSGLNCAFEKLRFRDGLTSVDGRPNRINKAAFSNFQRYVDVAPVISYRKYFRT